MSFFSGIGQGFSNNMGFGGGASGGVSAAINKQIGQTALDLGNIPVSNVGRFKMRRGMWDAADPLYYAANGNENVVGNVVSDFGVNQFKSAAQKGDLLGMAAGGLTKATGSLINAMFGTRVNKEKLARTTQGTDYLKNYNSTASTTDEIFGPMAVQNVENAYGAGWFRKGWARRRNRKLRDERAYAQDWAYRALDNNIDNISRNQIDEGLANYAAFGGPLSYTPITGAIDYDFAQRRLAQKDMEIMNEKALGGPLHTHGADWTNGITFVNNGGSHESNPFEGVPMGVAPDGNPNLVEEGEVIFDDYVFSNRLKVPKAVRDKYKLRGLKDMTFADAAKKAQKESEERPNDPISQRGLEDIMNKLMVEQETVREKRQQRKFADGGTIHIAKNKRGTFTAAAKKHGMGVQEFASKVLANPEDYSPAMRKKANFARNASKWKHDLGGYLYADGDYLWNWDTMPQTAYEEMQTNPTPWVKSSIVTPQSEVIVPYRAPEPSYIKEVQPDSKNKFKWDETWLRYAPALGSAIGLAHSIFNKPDYRNSKRIEYAADNLMRDVDYMPIGNYLTYRPFDRLFYANQLAAQSAATRRALINNSGANRATATAGILASDYNTQLAAGNLFRQAEEYNLAQRERVEDFNRNTNIVNSTNDLKAKIASGEIRGKKLSAIIEAAKMREAADAARMAAISSNLTNFFDNLGDIGIDAYNRKDRDMLIKAGVYGALSQKPQEWSEERWRDYQRALSGIGYKRGNGGKIKRRGITI